MYYIDINLLPVTIWSRRAAIHTSLPSCSIQRHKNLPLIKVSSGPAFPGPQPPTAPPQTSARGLKRPQSYSQMTSV